jgi:glycosyltransferase involved in cell wall biosynthesis
VAQKISVVTPSFNQAQFFETTMASIHEQDYPDLEHIVIDGGSTDGSVEIIKRYSDQLAFWVSEPDRGQTDALIKGFERSTGEIQCWLNSDDLFEPWTLSEVARFFEENPDVDFVYGDSIWIDDLDRPIKSKREHGFNRFIWMYDHNYIPQPSAFWRRSLFDRVGGLDPHFDLAMDADLWIRFAEVTRPSHVRRNWSRARLYADQKNTRLRERSESEFNAIRSRYTGQESPTISWTKKALARSLHVFLKLVTGCYSLRETRLHLSGLTDGGWEKRELSDRG